MSDLQRALEHASDLIPLCEDLAVALEAARKGISDEQWDALCDNPLIDAVLTAAMEIEDHIA
jgi:hypothetical protein